MAATMDTRGQLRTFNELLENPEGRRPFAKRMLALRRQNGYSQYTCADALGVDQTTYRGMELGEVRFRRRDLITLAALYRLPLYEAFPGAV